jgi:CRISPR-associated protein Cas1
MLHALNTLYVMTPGAYLRLDHDTVKVEIERDTKLQMPLLHLAGITCFGNVLLSPAIMHRCAEDGRAVVLLDANGRFKARLVGKTSGNVLLRQAQHQASADPTRAAAIARTCVAGKLQNTRHILLRAAREATTPEDTHALTQAAGSIARSLERLARSTRLDQVRGHEGDAARAYFQVFNHLLRTEREEFRFTGRVRRPPIGRTNALLSFLYALLLNDCVAAAESVGLDPQVGFLHVVRPGRPALALDLLEELRAYVADRLVLTLINRQQLRPNDFEILPGGAARLSDAARRRVVVAYQERKQQEVRHPLLDRKVPLAVVPHIQAQLLARHLRGDLDAYPPFLAR